MSKVTHICYDMHSLHRHVYLGRLEYDKFIAEYQTVRSFDTYKFITSTKTIMFNEESNYYLAEYSLPDRLVEILDEYTIYFKGLIDKLKFFEYKSKVQDNKNLLWSSYFFIIKQTNDYVGTKSYYTICDNVTRSYFQVLLDERGSWNLSIQSDIVTRDTNYGNVQFLDSEELSYLLSGKDIRYIKDYMRLCNTLISLLKLTCPKLVSWYNTYKIDIL